MTDLKTLYDKDFVAWSQEQAQALRAAARTGSNQRLDWENLAEEIEDLGKRDRRELASRIATIVEHLVKLEHSGAKEPRSGWQQTVRRERAAIERLLEDSPSLNREVSDLARKETRRAAEAAVADLKARSDLSRSLQQSIKAKSYLDLFQYTPDQVLSDWFPPEPKP